MAYLREHEVHVAKDGGYTSTIFHMSNIDGEVQVESCVKCDHVNVVCLHTDNTWHDEDGKPIPMNDVLSGEGPNGVALLCNLCGADGT